MFSGIVEEMARVVGIERDREMCIYANLCFVDELKIDQSVSHNGVCLTVVKIDGSTYTVTAMRRSIANLGLLRGRQCECGVRC